MDLLLGTNNIHKMREVREIIDMIIPGRIRLLMPKDVLPGPVEVHETGFTLEENAEIKAVAFFNAAELPVIADDTGLEIDALGGAPGVYSARFAGKDATDAMNRRKVLKSLRNTPAVKRTAHFRTVFCYKDETRMEFAEGVCSGSIIREERGQNGFGYDPIFVPEGYDLTFAELPPEEKNRISHRVKAIRNLAALLKLISG